MSKTHRRKVDVTHPHDIPGQRERVEAMARAEANGEDKWAIPRVWPDPQNAPLVPDDLIDDDEEDDE